MDDQRATADAKRPQVFISYSRSETPLVEDLYDKLAPLDRFLDFRSLVPGSPWEPQLRHALEQADVVVLVVSERSVWTSQPTRDETRWAVDAGKRIVLALAEWVPLPAELATREWVDLRFGSFDARCADLRELVCLPEGRPDLAVVDARDRGAPEGVRITMLIAWVVALLSLPFVWTVVLPVVLFALPAQIRRRRFNYASVRLALLTMPFLAALFFDVAMKRIPRDEVGAARDHAAMFGSPVVVRPCARTVRGSLRTPWGAPLEAAARPDPHAWAGGHGRIS